MMSTALRAWAFFVALMVFGGDDGFAAPIPVAAALTPEAALAQAAQRAGAAAARGDASELVRALNDEADECLKLHRFSDAEQLRLRVLHLQEDHAGHDSLPVADALLNLGWFYNNMARYDAAQEALDRCRDIRERLAGPESVPVAEALNALAALEENRSNLSLAEAFYQQAIAIREKTLGPQNPDTATTWNNLATLYRIMGDYASAQKLFLQALAVREKSFGPESLAVAATLDNLAQLDADLGDFDQAESGFQRVLRIRSARLPPDHPLITRALNQLGMLYVREGDDARAEPLLVKTVAVEEQTYQDDNPDVARSLMQLAMLYDRQGDYAKAGPLLDRALQIRRRILGPDHPEYAASVAALARHDHAQGQLAAALPLYQEAYRIDTDVLGMNHPDTVAVATGLAYLQLELGDRDDAGGLVRDVAEAQQNALNGVFTFTPERQRIDFEKTVGTFDLPAALGDPALMAEVVLRTKGVVLDSLLEDEAVQRASRDPAVRELLEKRRLLSTQLAQEDAASLDFSDSPNAAAARKKLEDEERDLESALAGQGIGGGRMRRALATDVSDVEDALPPDAALVDYVAYNRYTSKLGTEPAYGAVILAHGVAPQWIPLGPAAGIESQVRLYQKYMRRRVHEAALVEVLRGLDETLMAQVTAALPPGTKRLVISPDGSLDFVSFATLLDSQNHFLAEDYELNYVSSGRDLLGEAKGIPLRKRLVIFADPDYSHAPGEAAGGRHRGTAVVEDDLLERLPGAEREALFLQTQARQAGLGVELYQGASASKTNLTAQQSPYILHLATHGLYLSPDDFPNLPAPPAAEDAAGLAGQAMQRSLLALSGASLTLREWKKGIFPAPENDGLLTAQDVAGLDLEKTWLVVLSACDSGSGEVQAGEGVLGLRRGFAEAGAQNLLLTLWTVDDSETAALMQAFYREALQSGDAPGALARVQRASLEALREKSGVAEAARQAGPFILSY